MKTFGVLFIILVAIILSKLSYADTKTPEHQIAYCNGYADAMAKQYRKKYYYRMQKYFSDKNKSTDQLSTEYYQSGIESVQAELSVQKNLKQKCEDQFRSTSWNY